MSTPRLLSYANGFARLAVGLVFALNVSCALLFILRPQNYVAGFEVSGVPGKAIVQGLGILFLMWNVTYPAVLLRPSAYPLLFAIILIQQTIGVVGETWLYLQVPAQYAALRATGLRFIIFDGGGLLLMGAAFALLQIYIPLVAIPRSTIPIRNKKPTP